jgi:hypothetical protein
MKIVSIEPTPSPNVMKITLDQSLPKGVSYSFQQSNRTTAPKHLQKILEIEGVKSVFQVLDFISVERHPKADWQAVLAEVRKVFGETVDIGPTEEMDASFQEVQVFIQKWKGIPIQVKLIRAGEEHRFALPERFQKAVMTVKMADPNFITERQWVEQSPRYGDPNEVGEQVVAEISAAYDEARLNRLVELALNPEKFAEKKEEKLPLAEVEKAMEESNWEKRYAALERWEPTLEGLPVLSKALQDEKPAIRRLAVVYLGMIGGKEVLPLLIQALKDASPIVRRTAGDTLSDLGDPEAIPAMCEALKDPNKLVRWRAARYLYEVGDEQAIPALQEAVNDPEFEIRLQAKMALERIERGEEASGTIWQQMTREINKQKGQ